MKQSARRVNTRLADELRQLILAAMKNTRTAQTSMAQHMGINQSSLSHMLRDADRDLLVSTVDAMVDAMGLRLVATLQPREGVTPDADC